MLADYNRNAGEPWVDTALIFIYSGWRISELLALTPEDVGNRTYNHKTLAELQATVELLTV